MHSMNTSRSYWHGDNYVVSPPSVEFNDRIRIFNIKRLLHEHMDPDKNYKKLNFDDFKHFLYTFSLQVGAMNASSRAFKKRLEWKDKGFDSSHMGKLWIYLSYLHNPIILEKFGTSFGQLLIDAVKEVLKSFPELLETAYELERLRDVSIKLTKHRDTILDNNAKKERIRPHLCPITEDKFKEDEKDISDYEFLSSVFKYDEVNLFDEPELSDYKEKYDNRSLDTISSVLNLLEARRDRPNEEHENLAQILFNTIEEENLFRDSAKDIKPVAEKTLDKTIEQCYEDIKKMKKQLKTILDNLAPTTVFTKNSATFLMSLLYESECLKIVYKAIKTIKTFHDPINVSETNGKVIIQTIVFFGEALTASNDQILENDWTIVSVLINLRNLFEHFVIWDDVQDFPSWNELCEELFIMEKKIEVRLKLLEECFQTNDTDVLREILKIFDGEGFSFLYDAPIQSSYRDTKLGSKVNKENQKIWQENNYPYIRSLLSKAQLIKQQKKGSAVPLLSDVNDGVDKLEKIVKSFSQPGLKLKDSILNTLIKDDANEDLSVFLQIFNMVNFIYQNFKSFIQYSTKHVPKFLENLNLAKEFKFLKQLFLLLEKGRNLTIHEMWRKEYETLANVVCLVVSNLKPILQYFNEKRKPLSSENITLWRHLIIMRNIIDITNDKNKLASIKAERSWLMKHIKLSDAQETKLFEKIEEVVEKSLISFFNGDPLFVYVSGGSKLDELMLGVWVEYQKELLMDKPMEYNSVEQIVIDSLSKLVEMEIAFDMKIFVEKFKNFVEKEKDTLELNTFGVQHYTPLTYALNLYVNNDDKKDPTIIQALVEVLLKNGANPDLHDLARKHPLHYANSLNNDYQKILKEKCNLIVFDSLPLYSHTFGMKDQKSQDNLTFSDGFFNPVTKADILHVSIIYDSLYNTNWIASPNLYDSMGNSPLHILLSSSLSFASFTNIFDILNKMECDINQQTIIKFKNGKPIYEETPLILAAKKCHFFHNSSSDETFTRNIIQELISKGADCNIRDTHLMLPIKYAKANLEVVKTLALFNNVPNSHHLSQIYEIFLQNTDPEEAKKPTAAEILNERFKFLTPLPRDEDGNYI